MNFGFLLFPGLEELDLVGPWEMINMWREHAGGPEACFTVSETGAPVVCSKGMRIMADHGFDDCPPLDYLLIPGGRGTRAEIHNDTLIDFVRDRSGECRHVLSVCTGSFILAQAGLLEGRRAATHWSCFDRLGQWPGVQVVQERFVRDGNFWSSSGVAAGIDLALAFIADQAGEEVAGTVQFQSEYYPDGRRYGRQHQNPEAPAYLNR